MGHRRDYTQAPFLFDPKIQGSGKKDDEIVQAARKLVENLEQGIRIGRCGWITSFLRSIRVVLCLMPNSTHSSCHLKPNRGRAIDQ